MKRDWLWDRKVDLGQVKRIFANPKHKDFILFAALLLTRKNQPREVFKEYIDPLVFCKDWVNIKRQMRKDKWSNQRIDFWQAIYEKLIEKYRKKGVKFRDRKEKTAGELCEKAGKEIRKIRKSQGLSQKALAKKMGVSQQLISRIERGDENMSLTNLTIIARALDENIELKFIPPHSPSAA